MKKFSYALLGALISMHAYADDSAVDQALIKRGEYLARAGDCVACHTAKGGKSFAGGLPMETPIGVIYSTNITPDKLHGIGSYSFEQFDNAVRHGVTPDGATLYPAMPYPSYARVTPEDMNALYAYFMHGIDAEPTPNKESDIPWPLSMRWPLSIWRWMYAPNAIVTQETSSNAMVGRGAYLVEGLGHCGTCHTPRALTMQEKALSPSEGDSYLAGGAPLDGWVAKNLRGDMQDGLGSWTEEELVQFFKTGRTDRTAAFGGMTDVIEHSLQHLSDSDLASIAKYLKQLPPAKGDVALKNDGSTTKMLHDLDIQGNLGARVYADNCMACHRSDGAGYAQTFPGLAGNGVLNSADPTSVIRIVLGGHTLPATHTAVTPYTMPGFGWRLPNDDVAAVVSFIRSGWGNTGGKVSAKDVQAIRETMNVSDLKSPGTGTQDGAANH